LIEVVLKIEKGLELEEYTDDMTAQLKSIGITGIMFIGLDRKRHFDPARTPEIAFESDHPVIASIPSDIKKYMEGLEDVLNQLGSMDVEGISTRVKHILDRLDQTVADAQIKGISTDIRSALAKFDRLLVPDRWDNILEALEGASVSFDTVGKDTIEALDTINKTAESLNRLVTDNASGVSEAIHNFQNAMKTADTAMADGSELLRQTHLSVSTLLDYLLETEQNIESATDNLRRFMTIIADQPSQLILGQPPPAREIEDK